MENPTKILKKFSYVVLATILVFSILFISLHHHNNFQTHNNCVFCKAKHPVDTVDYEAQISWVEYVGELALPLIISVENNKVPAVLSYSPSTSPPSS
ncbi:MAG: hypothetical protein PF689_07110 [Deltaproteobacteria bacterium]|jgi:hypothetical protein|nr:hypothetical protein [Deltaproteobacteria bacterium]